MKMLIGVLAGITLALSVPVIADQGGRPHDVRRCRELVDLVLVQYDRAYAAQLDLERALWNGTTPRRAVGRPETEAAYVRLIRLDNTWSSFWELARTCARIRS